MSGDESTWVDEAFRKCKSAPEGITVAFVRLQDDNDEADVIVTNAKDAEMVKAIAAILRAENTEERGEENS